MPLPQSKRKEIQKRFREIGDGSVRFVATREEVLDFIDTEVDAAFKELRKKIRRAVSLKKRLVSERDWDQASEDWGYNYAIADILDLPLLSYPQACTCKKPNARL